jgi:hypothetical protein
MGGSVQAGVAKRKMGWHAKGGERLLESRASARGPEMDAERTSAGGDSGGGELGSWSTRRFYQGRTQQLGYSKVSRDVGQITKGRAAAPRNWYRVDALI